MTPYKDDYPLLPFVKDSDTSAEAAARAHTAQRDRQRVLAYMLDCKDEGATDDEIEIALGLLHQTASARRRELELKGIVERTGRRRPTRSGRSAGVYIVPEALR